MIDKALLKKRVQGMIDKNVFSEEVNHDLEAILMIIDPEPVRPEWDPISKEYHCPMCGTTAEYGIWGYCWNCGKEITWDGA